MKSSHKYIIFIVVFVLLCFALGQRMPRKFAWDPTFAHTDRQPFGCYVLDSIMADAMPRGYAVERRTFSQINADTALRLHNVLVLCNELNLNRIDLRSLNRMLHNGSHVMIALAQINYETADSTLAYDYGLALYGRDYFTVEGARRLVNGQYGTEQYDSIYWGGTGAAYPPMLTRTFSGMVSSNIMVDSHMDGEARFDTLLWYSRKTEYPMQQSRYFRHYVAREREMQRKGKLKEYNDSSEWLGVELDSPVTVKTPLAVTRPVGKGRLTLVTLPLAFTNYGVLDTQLSPMLMRLMTQLADRPILRTTAYMKTSAQYEAEQSPMRFVLSRKPLRNAWYLGVLTLVLFCVFKARRRQRVIPVVRPPQNHSLEFARLIGTLYYQRADNADLVRKKCTFFAERVRTTLQVDVLDRQLPPDAPRLIARRTGQDEDEVTDILRRLRLNYWTEGKLSDSEMQWAIDSMDRIVKLL